MPPFVAVTTAEGGGGCLESYLTVAERAEAELIEKRSRFIGTIVPAKSEEEAAALLSELRSVHWKANHNCYAYILRQGGVMRCSDDGEPQGTAGMPILEVLRREGVVDVAVVVTRYFGGVLLGAGGLTRAYGSTAKLALDAGRVVRMCKCADFLLEAPYAMYEQVKRLLEPYPMQLLDTDFAGSVTLSVRMRSDALPGFAAALTELSAGSLEPVVTGEIFTGL